MTMTSENGLNYVVSGFSTGIQQWTTDNDNGVGFGPTDYTLSGFTSNANNLWQFDIGYDSSGGQTNNLIAHPGQNLSAIDSIVNTKPLIGPFPGTTLAPVGVFTVASCYLNGSTIIINGANYLVGNGPVSYTHLTLPTKRIV